MKVFTAIFLLFSLQLAVPVFSDSLDDLRLLMSQLRETAMEGFSYSNKEIGRQGFSFTNRITFSYQQIIFPSITRAYKDIDDYINDLQNTMTSAGFDIFDCIQSTRAGLALIPNVTEKATQHLEVYNNILTYITRIGQSNNAVIFKEFDSITTQYNACLASVQPQYCSDTVAELLTSKRVRILDLFLKQIARTNLAYLREFGHFESRSAEYVGEIVSASKPYLSLLENCVSAALVA